MSGIEQAVKLCREQIAREIDDLNYKGADTSLCLLLPCTLFTSAFLFFPSALSLSFKGLSPFASSWLAGCDRSHYHRTRTSFKLGVKITDLVAMFNQLHHDRRSQQDTAIDQAACPLTDTGHIKQV